MPLGGHCKIHGPFFPIPLRTNNLTMSGRKTISHSSLLGRLRNQKRFLGLRRCYHLLLLLAVTSNNIYVLIDATPYNDKSQYCLSLRQQKNSFKTSYLFHTPTDQMATKFNHQRRMLDLIQ